ncbi:PAQR family membrane homeostasis protein TrhA [Marinoscillum sp.]|uniref:PAQR family membrane homeostasis protein TrhA n=1 Tax=Marinoscillum sp. TaxID=2024838 RepID=UPI003BA92359
MNNPITYYKRKEELLNVITHLAGLVLSIAGLALLVTFASIYGSVWHIVSFSIFGSTLVLLYLASTLYHAAKKKQLRKRLNVFDHSAIYVLIAGTYTPFCLVTLNGWVGWTLFGITWGLAIAGVTLKVFFTGRFNLLSTIGYVAMGWIAIVAAKPLFEQLSSGALWFLILGGVSYTIGAIFYLLDRMKYNHAIFHVWVLLGSILHFIAVFFFLL